MAIEWNTSYETGEPRIDEQHRNLVGYVNRLERLLESTPPGSPADREEVDNLLVFLESYVNTHFAYEELCMTLRGCPVARKNKEAHDRFLALYAEFTQQHKARGGASVEMLRELHATLKNWLVGHICNIDVQLRGRTPAGSA
ncbi:Bacteriohemerythrin [Calidithermus terrae]|uniref:Bacteriohemerythrin n=1 Tax=Calidithermus terrae TaxID=1408545 RepID=A0A399EDF4_9DEIN|nr:hemerythrin family protein [Calidithermus terrae]RIH82365.1 Bacteriohemerythrin [Calidithermus terrae]